MTSAKVDYKKDYKDLYLPKAEPSLINVPAMTFIMVDGKGDPNHQDGEYQKAVELLYALSYTIKMAKKENERPSGYYEYTVFPLEGLWWMANDLPPNFINKADFFWTSMIRQPDFVTEEVFARALSSVAKKKPHLDINKARLETFTEGLCVQIMHIGLYDSEPQTIALMEAFIKDHHYRNAIPDPLPGGMVRRHHEIYLSDPRKVDSAKLKTAIRHPVKKS